MENMMAFINVKINIPHTILPSKMTCNFQFTLSYFYHKDYI